MLTHKIKDRTVAVSTTVEWMLIDDKTPLGVKMLIDQSQTGYRHYQYSQSTGRMDALVSAATFWRRPMKPTDLQGYYPRQDPPASEIFVGGLIAGTLLTFAVLWILGAL